MIEYHTTIKIYKTNRKINKKQNPTYSMITNYLLSRQRLEGNSNKDNTNI